MGERITIRFVMDGDAVCCAECNATRVIPAHIKLSQEAESRGIY